MLVFDSEISRKFYEKLKLIDRLFKTNGIATIRAKQKNETENKELEKLDILAYSLDHSAFFFYLPIVGRNVLAKRSNFSDGLVLDTESIGKILRFLDAVKKFDYIEIEKDVGSNSLKIRAFRNQKVVGSSNLGIGDIEQYAIWDLGEIIGSDQESESSFVFEGSFLFEIAKTLSKYLSPHNLWPEAGGLLLDLEKHRIYGLDFNKGISYGFDPASLVIAEADSNKKIFMPSDLLKMIDFTTGNIANWSLRCSKIGKFLVFDVINESEDEIVFSAIG